MAQTHWQQVGLAVRTFRESLAGIHAPTVNEEKEPDVDNAIDRRRSVASSRVSADEEPVRRLSRYDCREIQELLREAPGLRDVDRCVTICHPLRFFRRFNELQVASMLRVGALLKASVGTYIERAGDPLGNVYVVLSGSVVMEEHSAEIGGRKVFAHTIFDGGAFGDGFNLGEDSAEMSKGRKASYAAQEDSLLLRMATVDYEASVADVGVEADNFAAGGLEESMALLRGVNFFDGCAAMELQVLAMLLECRLVRFGESAIAAGDRPQSLCVLRRGQCKLRVGDGFEVGKLRPGEFFGQGALATKSGTCKYKAQVAVVVESSSAEFWLLGASSLQTLSDVTQDRIRALVAISELEDPIRNDAWEAIKRDKRWQRQKRRFISEVARCSSRGGVPRGMSRDVRRPPSAPTAGRPQPLRPPWVDGGQRAHRPASPSGSCATPTRAAMASNVGAGCARGSPSSRDGRDRGGRDRLSLFGSSSSLPSLLRLSMVDC